MYLNVSSVTYIPISCTYKAGQSPGSQSSSMYMDCGRGGSRILKRGVLKVHNNYVGGLGVCLPRKISHIIACKIDSGATCQVLY